MKSIAQSGLKITPATREYYRYTGPSAELERRGTGSSLPDLSWVRRLRDQQERMDKTGAALDGAKTTVRV